MRKTVALFLAFLGAAVGAVAGVGISLVGVDHLPDGLAMIYGEKPGTVSSSPAANRPRPAFAELALAFESNQGQADPRFDFLARARGYLLQLSASDAVLTMVEPRSGGSRETLSGSAMRASRQTELRMKLVGANPRAARAAHKELPGKVSYFLGGSPAGWRGAVPTYSRVGYDAIYNGIDLVYYGNQRELEYDFVVAPGANPKIIRLDFEGIDELIVGSHGELLLRKGQSTLLQLQKPVAYQDMAGGRQEVAANYETDGRGVSIRVGDYDTTRALVIDPVLYYSSRLGGNDDDAGYAIAVGPGGDVYLTGETSSAGFPGTAPQQTPRGSTDVFVTRLSADGSHVVYSAYLGGSGADVGYGIAVDTDGNAYVTGDTQSADFPLVTPWQNRLAGTADVFVAKLSADGSRLVYATYFGGSGGERGLGIAVDPAGSAYVTGYTNSRDLPVYNAFQKEFAGGNADAFVLKLAPDGSMPVFATYLGGGNDRPDIGTSIAADADGNAFVTGFTNSINFPTANPLQPFRGPTDAFVTKFNPTGSALVYSTHLGGTADDEAMGIAVDAAGSAYVTGHTESLNFPTTPGAFRTGCVAVPVNIPIGNICSGGDAFVSKLSPDGTKLVYSTYINGKGFEVGRAIAVDAAGNAHVTGLTNSPDFPVVNAVQGAYGGGSYDAFVVKINPAGSALTYATYLGGADEDGGYGIAVNAAGDAWIGGYTKSSDFPMRRPLRESLARSPNSDKDSFIAKISDMPEGHHH